MATKLENLIKNSGPAASAAPAKAQPPKAAVKEISQVAREASASKTGIKLLNK